MSMVSVEEYQILQRNENGYADVPLRGKLPQDFGENSAVFARVMAEDNNSIVVGWEKCEIAKDEWYIQFQIPEGGLYRLEACHRSQDDAPLEWCPRICNIRHVGVGDLYLLTGQSNMAGYGRDSAYDPPCLGVHLYGNNGQWSIATHPLNDSVGTIYPENAEYTSGTSPALSFAKTLMRRLNLPIGLVQASLGGSAMSVWHPKEDGTLYRAALRRLDVVGKVKGVLWYQGCTDAMMNLGENYLQRFSDMITLWRQDLGPVPILTVQLNSWAHGETDSLDKDRQWGMVREAQRQAALQLPEVYVIPTIDLAIGDGIHNTAASNVAIGERLANEALRGIYGKGGSAAPSVLAAEKVDDEHLLIRFADERSVFAQDPLAGEMDIEDAEGLASCIRAESRTDGILLTVSRPFALPAKFHAVWRCRCAGYFPRDWQSGLPMLACYGVEVRQTTVSQKEK